jgi:hypothetical protein
MEMLTTVDFPAHSCGGYSGSQVLLGNPCSEALASRDSTIGIGLGALLCLYYCKGFQPIYAYCLYFRPLYSVV